MMVKGSLTLFPPIAATGVLPHQAMTVRREGCGLTDEELAARLAQGAGRLLMELRGSDFLVGATLGIVADKVANAFILTTLREWRPKDPILSEESPDRLERLGSDRLWVIDPLDGTREYAEGRSDWAVHVALAIE